VLLISTTKLKKKVGEILKITHYKNTNKIDINFIKMMWSNLIENNIKK